MQLKGSSTLSGLCMSVEHSRLSKIESFLSLWSNLQLKRSFQLSLFTENAMLSCERSQKPLIYSRLNGKLVDYYFKQIRGEGLVTPSPYHTSQLINEEEVMRNMKAKKPLTINSKSEGRNNPYIRPTQNVLFCKIKKHFLRDKRSSLWFSP